VGVRTVSDGQWLDIASRYADEETGKLLPAAKKRRE